MPSVSEKQRRLVGATLGRLREGPRFRTALAARQKLEELRLEGRKRLPRPTATSLLMRRLRFGSEWL